MSFSIALVPVFSQDVCDTAHASLGICSQSNFYNFSAARTFTSFGKTNGLSALSLTAFLSDSEAMPVQPYGLDNIGLGPASLESPIFVGQAVAGVASRDFMHGIFGFSNKLSGLGTIPIDGGNGSLLNASLELGVVPSNSFSYTAGAIGKNSTPSLVFGGYDASRVAAGSTLQVDITNSTTPSSVRFPLSVKLSAITFSTSAGGWRPDSFGGPTYESIGIDSAIPQIWLPSSACTIFEHVFGLEWDDTTQLYLINTTAHDRLLELNSSVTFSLTSSRSQNVVVNFTLPYSAFDLNVSYPIVSKEQGYYFPLKRASEASQYVFGRTFLQEAHISVDFDSGYFNLSQATHYGEPKLETIMTSTASSNTFKHENSTGLPSRAYAGISVGVGVAVITVVAIVLAWRKKWWIFAMRQDSTTRYRYDKAELHANAIPRVEAMEKEKFELPVHEQTCEVDGEGRVQSSVQGLNEIHEVHGDSSR
jgi:hypothetical protein